MVQYALNVPLIVMHVQQVPAQLVHQWQWQWELLVTYAQIQLSKDQQDVQHVHQQV